MSLSKTPLKMTATFNLRPGVSPRDIDPPEADDERGDREADAADWEREIANDDL